MLKRIREAWRAFDRRVAHFIGSAYLGERDAPNPMFVPPGEGSVRVVTTYYGLRYTAPPGILNNPGA